MTNWKDALLTRIEDRARRACADLAGEFARTKDGSREEILAELEHERWLAEACREARLPTDDDLGPLL